MPTATSAFAQSLLIIGREGLEVVLILGAMLAVLRKMSPEGRTSALWWGAGLAVVASLITAVIVQAAFNKSENVELLEGLTLALAAAVLLFVGHWLLAKADVHRWKAYLARRLERGVGAGSTLALALVAFLAVYREGVETVLFYRALLSTEEAGPGAVMAGFLLGVAALAFVCFGIYRFGVRIPLRPFFAATSAFLLLLSFVFAGKAVHELQEAGVVSEGGLALPRIAPLGIYPTLESVIAQALLLSAIAIPVLLRRFRPAAVSPVSSPARETMTGEGREPRTTSPRGVAGHTG